MPDLAEDMIERGCHALRAFRTLDDGMSNHNYERRSVVAIVTAALAPLLAENERLRKEVDAKIGAVTVAVTRALIAEKRLARALVQQPVTVEGLEEILKSPEPEERTP